MEFVNRTSELKKLKSLWEEKCSQLVVIYGRRRVGKTEVIKEFLKKTKGIYYLSDKRTHKDQLQEFARVVGNFFKDEFLQKKGFSSWIEAFEYIKDKSKKEKFVVAIDEYPYLVETDSSTSSVFQKIWDEYLKDTNIFLILCGSSISMMESELIAYKAPLYGRTTCQLLIEPMGFEESWKFFPKKNFSDFLSYYSITGGMPIYMTNFEKYPTILKAVENLCWDKNGIFYNAVPIILKQELRTPNNYFAILSAIAQGKTRLGEISTSTQLEYSKVNKYIKTLEKLQLVKRETPVTEEKPHKSKKGIYILKDNFVRFWFEYVFSFSSDLEIRNFKNAKEKFKKHSNILQAIAYEQIAREDLQKSFSLEKTGRFWNKDVEIDGIGFKGKNTYFMEAKCSKRKVNLRALNKLREKSKLVDFKQKNRKDFFVLYSRMGFTKDVVLFSKEKKNIFLKHL